MAKGAEDFYEDKLERRERERVNEGPVYHNRTDYQREYARKRRAAQRQADPPAPPGRPKGEPTELVQARVPLPVAEWVRANGGLRAVLCHYCKSDTPQSKSE